MKKILFFISVLLVFTACNKPDSEKVYRKWKGNWAVTKIEYTDGTNSEYTEDEPFAAYKFNEDGTVFLTQNNVVTTLFIYPEKGVLLKLKSINGETTYLTDKGFFGTKKVVTWENFDTKEVFYLKKIK